MKNQTSQPIFYYDRTGEDDSSSRSVAKVTDDATYYLPRWQSSPVFQKRPPNENVLNTSRAKTVQYCIEQQQATLTSLDYGPPGTFHDVDEPTTSFLATLRSMQEGVDTYYYGTPVIRSFIPIYDTFARSRRQVVGALSSILNFRYYLTSVIPDHMNGIIVVLQNTCNEQYTYQLDGANASAVGFGDLHDTNFNHMKETSGVLGKEDTIPDGTNEGTTMGASTDSLACQYYIDVYPSSVSIDTCSK
jgi:hypothetical protein